MTHTKAADDCGKGIASGFGPANGPVGGKP
jgi:hypothetical protein